MVLTPPCLLSICLVRAAARSNCFTQYKKDPSGSFLISEVSFLKMELKLKMQGIFGIFGLLFLMASWILPNKAYPWLPAWNEGLAFVSAFLIWLSAVMYSRRDDRNYLLVSWPLVIFCVLTAVSAFVQYAMGLLLFYGDAVVLTLYLGMFLLAAQAAALMVASKQRDAWLRGLMTTISLGGILSAGIALTQWTHTWSLVVFMLEDLAGERPGANLGQINHLNTLCFIACCAILFLWRKKQIGLFAFLMASIFLTLGMALSQSRTGLLQMSFVFMACLVDKKNYKFNFAFLSMLLAYAIWYFSVPEIGRTLQLTAESHFRGAPTSDVRLTMWRSLYEASLLRPWFGYGWLQTGWAQQTVAESFPIYRSYMSYGHNMALDFLIWTGFPIAIALMFLLCLWLFWNIRNNSSDEKLFILCAIVGMFIHAMLEYPLSYAYFLIPLGLMMGLIDGMQSQFGVLRFNIKIQSIFFISLVAIFARVAIEYIDAVEVDTTVRMKDAQIGTNRHARIDLPDFLLLSQLDAMYRVRSLNIEEGADDDTIPLLKDVVRRYPYSPAIVQYAWALARRGDAASAQKELRVLCGIYSAAHCELIKTRWAAMQRMYPTAAVGIDFPIVMPRQ